MPRRRRLEGRRQRQGNRINMRTRRNVNVNANTPGNDNTNDTEVELLDNFRCALNEIPSNFKCYDVGPMNFVCRFCSALHFESEITANDRDRFTSCCHKGKVDLLPLAQNDFFQALFDGLTSTDQSIKRRSQNYFDNIRQYNAAFAMVSSEAKIADTVLRGVYHFKIHDNFYHRVAPLTPTNDSLPSYAQLYFYDVDTAVNYRMQVRSNASCDNGLMRDIAIELERINSFVRSFITMREYCQRSGNENREVCMLITVNHMDIDNMLHERRINDATQTDVAAIFCTVDGEPPFERNIISFSKTTGEKRNVSVLNSALDPLSYPLLFPSGQIGFFPNIPHSLPSRSRAAQPRTNVTMLQYASYRIATRDGFSLLHQSQKLFLQWIVDMYVRIEGSRLYYIRQNQSNLRSEVYSNLTDYLRLNSNDNGERIGRSVILPSSFTGSPRNMYQNYLDAMSIVQKFGKPSLFITMTCNPKWPEIMSVIGVNNASHFRPEIVVRVFNAKLKELINIIKTKHVLGRVEALIYTIEFQKRGLPHAHILITLVDDDKILGPVDIDKVVCAEIPDPNTHPKLHEFVAKHMMHGPCGQLKPNAVCMKDGKCAKNFPKDFNEATRESVNGYPLYKRRDLGRSVDVRGNSLDNRFVVPYNPYLLAKFGSHINVEVCTTVKSVKYIYKYVYKGYDSATVEIGNENNAGSSNGQSVTIDIDEIKDFVSGRYVGSTEAIWRILENPMHFQSHSIIRLDIHLPNQQTVLFREGQEQIAAQNAQQTKLLAFFQLNRIDWRAREYKYSEIPLYYVWIDAQKKWQQRQRGGDKIVTRMYIVSPKNIELFHLRLLLLHVVGPQSFEDVRTYNGIVYNTFVEACHARGIASNDNEWRECLNEAKEFQSPKQMRHLFGVILALNVPANALTLWNEFKIHLSEDFLRDHLEEEAFNYALLEIEEILIVHYLSCHALGLPVPTIMQNRIENDAFDPDEAAIIFADLYANANEDQKNIIDRVIREVQFHDTGSNVFCLTAHAGCGKTFTVEAIIHRLHSLNLKCIATAFSGIASTLLLGGKTLHNAFKLPIPCLENSVANVSANSSLGRQINSASLIIIDEISMCPVYVLKTVDRLLRDLCTNVNDRAKLFGGKVVLLCGDFRQILPVVPRASRAILIENCVTTWNEFQHFHKISLTRNMRALPHELDFVEFLKKIGNGEGCVSHFGGNVIELPQQIIGNERNVIEDTFGHIASTIQTDRVMNSVILAPKNDDCNLINSDILNRIPGIEKVYYSYDQIITENDSEINNYPVEFLNSINVSGLPPHRLMLKVDSIVLLIRNLNTKDALVNGTRMRVKCLHRNTIDCEVLTGVSRNKRVLIPRIKLTYSGTILPFNFQRVQFPLILAFAMTINKSQGQTFQRVGVLLKEPVFTHGQLYVAASRVRSFDSLKFYICNDHGQGHLANDHRVFTKNIVYSEVLDF